jgi:hypothetical protein
VRNDRAVLGVLENLSLNLRAFFPDLNALTTTSKFSIRIQLQKKQRMEELPLDTPAVHFYRS